MASNSSSKTVNVKGWWTATITTNSDGSRSISFSNNVWWWYGWSTITGNAWSGSVTRTNSDWSTYSWTVSWSWKNTSVSWNNNQTTTQNWTQNWTQNTKNLWFEPVNQVDFGGLQFWQGTQDSYQNSRNDMLWRYYAGRDNATADTIKNDLMQNAWFANASAADQQNTINKIMNLQNQYRNNSTTNTNSLTWDFDWNKYQNYWDWDTSKTMEWIKQYLEAMSNGIDVNFDNMKTMMWDINTMFQSKFDAQMQFAKEQEARFNAEWAKVEWQLDENTREQKSRLDKMEQTYNANLQKMQDMLEEYYTGTMTALEAKKAWESAAAASDLSAKGLNSAVVANTTAGLDKNYREQFNSLIKANVELWQQLNNDYADFMKNLVEQHQTIDQYQTNTLIDWVKMKQQYIDQQWQIMQDYVNNVYKPLETYYTKMSDTYTEQAVDSYSRELSNQAYNNASFEDRVSTLYNKLIATLWDYWDVTALSQYDWDLINELANNKNLSKDQAMIELLKRVGSSGKWQDSAIYDALNSYNASRWNNVSTTNPTSNNNTNNNPNYSDDSDTRLANITENLSKYAKSNPELFADRNKFNTFFKYDQRSDKQKAVLDEYFNAFNQANKWTTKDKWMDIYNWVKLNYGVDKDIMSAIATVSKWWNTYAEEVTWYNDIINKLKEDQKAIQKAKKDNALNSYAVQEYNKALAKIDKDLKQVQWYYNTAYKMWKNWQKKNTTTDRDSYVSQTDLDKILKNANKIVNSNGIMASSKKSQLSWLYSQLQQKYNTLKTQYDKASDWNKNNIKANMDRVQNAMNTINWYIKNY